jgi:long-subunit acyl-CoA synthetase (AMP-forming)
MSRILQSPIAQPPYPANLARMLNVNSATYARLPIYQEARNSGTMQPLSWQQLKADVRSLQLKLGYLGLKTGDRVAFLSANRVELLELELAVMAMGAVSVPIFPGYSKETCVNLVTFCEPTLIALSDQAQLDKLEGSYNPAGIIHFDALENAPPNALPFKELLSQGPDSEPIGDENLPPSTVALMMYTSGTMGRPKCVQLTHGNILSQQAAMKALWHMSHKDRLLSYLPWHHSFGGIFEKFAAITNGAVLSLEHGYGRDIDLLLENWRAVKPTVFFSVPRIYQALATRSAQDAEIERLIFHNNLRFIFTAAAPLPAGIAQQFIDRGIQVIEGWGLTETSPCCTVTDPESERIPGIVGHPIPGVELKLATDGEILVRGENVMAGYFHNGQANKAAFTDDGWFRTGDVGAFTEHGLKLISRKDRIFKLSNAEKVIPAEIENLIAADCAYMAQAYVAGSGKDHPVALLFPNRAMFEMIPDESRLKAGCRRPGNLQNLAHCLTTCLNDLNTSMTVKYNRLQAAMLIDYNLSIENSELTPSMKLAPNVVGRVFKANIESLYGNANSQSDKVYVINLDQ